MYKRQWKYQRQIASNILSLKPHTWVSIIVPISQPKTLASVPDLAIKRDALGDYVFVLEADTDGSYRAKLVPVELGERQGEHVMIHAGIEPGQLIANKGSFKLFPSMKVYITNESAKEATTSDVSIKE